MIHDCFTDIDECARDLNNCHENGSCTDNNGSFECTCGNGYSGDGVNCTSKYPIQLTVRVQIKV